MCKSVCLCSGHACYVYEHTGAWVPYVFVPMCFNMYVCACFVHVCVAHMYYVGKCVRGSVCLCVILLNVHMLMTCMCILCAIIAYVFCVSYVCLCSLCAKMCVSHVCLHIRVYDFVVCLLCVCEVVCMLDVHI